MRSVRLIVSTHRDAAGLYRESLRVGVLREAARATPEARLRRSFIHREGRTLPGHQLDFAGRVELEIT